MTAAPALQALNHSLNRGTAAKIKMRGRISRAETEEVMHPDKKRWMWEREREREEKGPGGCERWDHRRGSVLTDVDSWTWIF